MSYYSEEKILLDRDISYTVIALLNKYLASN